MLVTFAIARTVMIIFTKTRIILLVTFAMARTVMVIFTLKTTVMIYLQ